MTTDHRPLIEGSVVRATLRFGAPLAAALTLHGLFNFVDIAFVGRLDAGAIAAVSIAGVVVMIPMLLFDAVSGAAVAALARAYGAGDDDAFRDVARALWWSAGLAGFLCLAAVGPARLVIDGYFEPGSAVARAGRDYLDIMMCGAAGMFFLMSASAVFRGRGRSFWPVTLLVGANLLNVLLNWMLIFGEWGAPRLEVAGAAHATVASRGAAALLGVGVLWFGASRTGGSFGWSPPTRREFARLLGSGMLVALQLSVRVIASLVVIRIACLGHRDAVALMDGVGVANRLEMIPVFLALGWGAAATTVVGQNMGAGRGDRALRGLIVAVVAAIVTGGAVALGLWVFRERCFDVMAPEASAVAREEAFRYLGWSLATFPFVAAGAVVARGLNGAGRFGLPLAIDASAYAVVLPIAAWFASRTTGSEGAWAAYAATHVGAAVVYLIVLFGGNRLGKLQENP